MYNNFDRYSFINFYINNPNNLWLNEINIIEENISNSIKSIQKSKGYLNNSIGYIFSADAEIKRLWKFCVNNRFFPAPITTLYSLCFSEYFCVVINTKLISIKEWNLYGSVLKTDRFKSEKKKLLLIIGSPKNFTNFGNCIYFKTFNDVLRYLNSLKVCHCYKKSV